MQVLVLEEVLGAGCAGDLSLVVGVKGRERHGFDSRAEVTTGLRCVVSLARRVPAFALNLLCFAARALNVSSTAAAR